MPTTVATTRKPFWAKCGACAHCWPAAYAPMEIMAFARAIMRDLTGPGRWGYNMLRQGSAVLICVVSVLMHAHAFARNGPSSTMRTISWDSVKTTTVIAVAEFRDTFGSEAVCVLNFTPNVEKRFTRDFGEQVKLRLSQLIILGPSHFGTRRYDEFSPIEFVANREISFGAIGAQFVRNRPRHISCRKFTSISYAEMSDRFNVSAKRLYAQAFNGDIGALQNSRLSNLQACDNEKQNSNERDKPISWDIGSPPGRIKLWVLLSALLCGLFSGLIIYWSGYL